MGLLYSHYEANPTIKINTCSGGIYKTYKESWFERFHLQSNRAESLFCSSGNIKIIQMVICGEMEVMAELIKENDLEKYFLLDKVGVEKE